MAKKRTTSSTKPVSKTASTKPSKTAKTVEGEGNRTADRNYRKAVREFAKTNDTTAIARKAAKEIDTEEASAKPAGKTKVDAKPVAKTAVKADAKPAAKADAKPAAKADAKPATKALAKANPKAASRSFLSIAVQQIRDSIGSAVGTAVQLVKRAIEPKARVTSR